MDHVFVLYDRGSNSVWYPGEDETLEAVGGKRKGEAIPFVDEPAPVALGAWLVAHPGSTVLLPTERDVKMMSRPYLGVGLDESADGRLVVTGVAEGSPAAEAGLQPGDRLVTIDARPVGGMRDLREILIDLGSGKTVDFVVERDGEKKTLPTELRPRPSS